MLDRGPCPVGDLQLLYTVRLSPEYIHDLFCSGPFPA